jgi:hypothetical protein
MPDNKDSRDQRDRGRVSGEENYELSYLQEKLGVSRDDIRCAIDAVGHNREKVEEYLKKHKWDDRVF